MLDVNSSDLKDTGIASLNFPEIMASNGSLSSGM